MIALIIALVSASAPCVDAQCRALVKVETRMDEFSNDIVKSEWHRAFAWTELTTSECPADWNLDRECRAFAAVRDSRWEALLELLKQGTVVDAHYDEKLEMVARLGLGQQQAAEALAEHAGMLARFGTHPLIDGLDAITHRLNNHQKWKKPIPALRKLSKKHGLRKLVQPD